MKTMILNGTTNSDSESIINIITQNLTCEYRIIDLYSLEMSRLITPEKEIDKIIESCHSIIIISPVVFGTLSGRLIEFASRYINSPLSFAPKIGLSVFVSNDGDIGYASLTAKSIMNCLNVQEKLPDVIVDNDTYNELLSMIDKINSKAENNVSDTIGTNAKITKYSSPQEKINLYRSLFKGREDVFALRWYNSKTTTHNLTPSKIRSFIVMKIDLSGVLKPRGVAIIITDLHNRFLDLGHNPLKLFLTMGRIAAEYCVS